MKSLLWVVTRPDSCVIADHSTEGCPIGNYYPWALPTHLCLLCAEKAKAMMILFYYIL